MFFFVNEMFFNFIVIEIFNNGFYKENYIRLCNEGFLFYGRILFFLGVSIIGVGIGGGLLFLNLF